jgi:predicted esterase
MIAKGFAAKPILWAKSRGALMRLTWAFRHPHQLTAFAGIYPVCNLLSWPLKNKPLPVLDDYKMSQDQLLHSIKAYNPIDQLKPLADAQVPIFLVHGTDDNLVPLSENSELVVENYQSLGGTVQLDRLLGMGHDETVDFLENQRVLHFLLQSKCDLVESSEFG